MRTARFAIRRSLARRVRWLEREVPPDLGRTAPTRPATRRWSTFGTEPVFVDAATALVVLGPLRMEASCFWPRQARDLARAEREMLGLICTRAEMSDGLSVLDVSCSRGGVGEWIADHYPSSTVTILAADASHRIEIEACLGKRPDGRVGAMTLADLETEQGKRFDRIFAVETAQGMSDPYRLISMLGSRLTPRGRLLAQLGCHRKSAYRLERGPERALLPAVWDSHGDFPPTMPANNLLTRTAADLDLLHHWELSGEHYQRTANAWLERFDANRDRILNSLQTRASAATARQQLRRWRFALLSTAELFGYFKGQEWWLSHYCFAPAGGTDQTK